MSERLCQRLYHRVLKCTNLAYCRSNGFDWSEDYQYVYETEPSTPLDLVEIDFPIGISYLYYIVTDSSGSGEPLSTMISVTGNLHLHPIYPSAVLPLRFSGPFPSQPSSTPHA
eukprot:COSAG05_NODE_5866_length_1070_cov_1.112255_1_plen_112_part_10